MNTFIIASLSQEKSRGEADKIIESYKISEFDIEIIETEKALGIEDVRNIQKKIFLKPFKGEKKAIILNLYSGVSEEAQNSMLKFLEEQPDSTLIFLLSETHHIFLPTIISRAKVIELASQQAESNSESIERILNLSGIGERLFLAQEIAKDKNEAIKWLEEVILSAREKMIQTLDDKKESLRLRKIIHKIELTHYDLKTTNANHRLALENLFLDI
jgi:DNA polymerase III gamma/tau subunit